jgi:hypothetical protein
MFHRPRTLGAMETPVPSINPTDADLAARTARAEVVVVLSPNTICPGSEVELELYVAANAGHSTYVIGWRRARPEERVRGWRGAWDGDSSGLTLGAPWWLNARRNISPTALADQQAGFDAYQAAWEAGDAARRSAR